MSFCREANSFYSFGLILLSEKVYILRSVAYFRSRLYFLIESRIVLRRFSVLKRMFWIGNSTLKFSYKRSLMFLKF